jgi:ParB family chromosome partitioning protein
MVHPAALLVPSAEDERSWVGRYTSADSGLEDADQPGRRDEEHYGGDLVDHSATDEEPNEEFREAAE